MSKILIVEDDRRINDGIKFNLEFDGFKVYSAFSLKEGNETLKKENIDLIILDVNLPDGNGFDFCKKLRESSNIPIIFLTANDMEMDQIRGFKLGGDDYITKPFNISLLTQRVIAILRRTNRKIIISGIFSLDLDKMTFFKDSKEIFLSPIEFKIIKKFMENEEVKLSRDEILKELWDENLECVEEHTLTVNINRIRNKIQEKNENYIKTVYGLGYMWSVKNEN